MKHFINSNFILYNAMKELRSKWMEFGECVCVHGHLEGIGKKKNYKEESKTKTTRATAITT